MKKVKISLMTLAIAAAVCCSFATRTVLQCEDMPQYYWNGILYQPAGEYLYNYDCDQDPAITCSYYKPDPAGHPNSFATCHLGSYLFIQVDKKPAAKK